MATRPFQQLALRFLEYTGRMTGQSLRRPEKSGFRGVSWNGQRNKWAAKITIGSKRRHVGLFDDPADAARAIKRARHQPPPARSRRSGQRSWQQWTAPPY